MDKTSKSVEQQEEMSSPVLLNSLDFPPLIVPVRPETISSPSKSRLNMAKMTYTKPLSNKRPLRDDVEEVSDCDSLSSSFNSESTDPLSPVKKFRKLSYREPPPVLQSLDSDAFKILLESPTLSDSQNSEAGLGSLSWAGLSATRATGHENLGSLGDIIQKCSTATLDSFKGFGMLDTDYAQNNTGLLSSSASRSTFSEGTNLEVLSSVSHSDVYVPAELSHAESGRGVSQSGFMSLTSDISSVSDWAHNHSTAQLSQPKQAKGQKSNEKLSSVKEDNVSEYSEEQAKTKIKESSNDDKSLNKVSEQKPEENDEDEEEEREEDSGDSDDEEYSVSDSPEADLTEYKKCKKNPKHLEFHSPHHLQVKDLPPEIQHEDSVTFLNCLSQLVVQITVHSTSAARGPNDTYSKLIGTNRIRNGSGFIASVDDEVIKYRCRREDCPYALLDEEFNSSFDDNANMKLPSSKKAVSNVSTAFNRSVSNTSNASLNYNRSTSNASTDYNRSLSNMSTASSSSSASGGLRSRHFFYSGVFIHTNKHVIFDKSEADNAYVKFFYDTPNGKGVFHGHVAAISGVNDSQDHVTLHVMSHEKILFTNIGLCLQNAKSSYDQMLQSTHRAHQALGNQHKHSWVAVLSHPHGMPKTVTFGRVRKEAAERTRIIKYYDAATCPGSSGGLVITPSLLRFQWPGAVHSCRDNVSGLNVTFDSRIQDLDYIDMGRIHKAALLNRKKSNSGDIFKI